MTAGAYRLHTPREALHSWLLVGTLIYTSLFPKREIKYEKEKEKNKQMTKRKSVCLETGTAGSYMPISKVEIEPTLINAINEKTNYGLNTTPKLGMQQQQKEQLGQKKHQASTSLIEYIKRRREKNRLTS